MSFPKKRKFDICNAINKVHNGISGCFPLTSKSIMNHFFLFFLMFLVLNVVTNLIPKARFKAIQMELIQIHNNATYRTWEYPHF